MFVTPKKTCISDGCEHKQARGKQHCWRHLKELKAKQVMSKEDQALIRSQCCHAACTIGEKHEYGEQYCKKCEQACIWQFAPGRQQPQSVVS